MPRPIATGQAGPIRKASTVRFDPIRGLTIVEPWESYGDNLVGLATQYAEANVAYELKRSPHRSELTATRSSGSGEFQDVITDTWQLQGNEIMKDIKELQRFLLLELAYPGTIRAVDTKAKQEVPPAPTWTDIASGAVSEAQVLYNLLIRGVTHYPIGQYVLRHTTSVGNAWASNVSDFNVESIYTTALLLSEIGSLGYWRTPCPPRLRYKISNIAAPASVSGYLWGWKKQPSTEGSSANNRIEISTEYILEHWPLAIYPVAS